MSDNSPHSDAPAGMSMAAAARYLEVSKDTIRRAVRRGELHAVRPNKQGDGYRIPERTARRLIALAENRTLTSDMDAEQAAQITR